MSCLGDKLPRAVTDELERLVSGMETKMSKRRATHQELKDLKSKITILEVENKWPKGYAKPGIGGDPALLDTTIGEGLVAKFRSREEANPLFNVSTATTMAQLKFMVSLSATRQLMYLDAEMLKVKIDQMGRDRLLDRTLDEMKSCVAARFKAYKDEGFEVPLGWDEAEQYNEKLKEFLENRYKDFLAMHADTVIEQKKSEEKMKLKETEAREKVKEAGMEVSLMAAVRSEATHIAEGILRKSKSKKGGSAKEPKGEVDKVRRQADDLLHAPPGLELNAATLAVAKWKGTDDIDDDFFVRTESKGKGKGKEAGKGKGKDRSKSKSKGKNSKGNGKGKGKSKGAQSKDKGKSKGRSTQKGWGNGWAWNKWHSRA